MSETEGGKDRRAHVYVSGIVQGVAFRYYAQHKAGELGVSGWVKNLPDGRVEAVFEGDDAAVDRLVGWCRRGPDRAHVERVETTAEAPLGEAIFRVTR